MKINTMKLKLTALLLVLYTGLYAQNKIVLTAPRLDTSSLSNRINLKANTSLNNVNGVLSSTYGGAGIINGILKANGSGVVSAAAAADIPSLSAYYLPLSGGTLTGALNGTSLSMSGGANLATSGGNVGIGTVAPAYKTDINSGADFKTLMLRANAKGTRFDVALDFNAVNVSTNPYARIGLQVSTASSGAEKAGLTFWTVNSGTLSEKMWLSPAGNLVLKTTTDNGTDALQVAGSGLFSSSVTMPYLSISTGSNTLANINSSNATGGYITWQTNGTTIADIGTATQVFGSGGSEVFAINGRGARAIALGTNGVNRLNIASTGEVSLSSSISSTRGVFNNSTQSQLEIFGWNNIQGASTNAGEIRFGGTESIQGRLIYSSAGNSTLYLDNTFDNANAEIKLRTRVAGTPVDALTLTSTAATFPSTMKSAGLIQPISLKTANYTLTDADYTVMFNTTSGNLTATLPAGVEGRIYNIGYSVLANQLTIVPNGSETINGDTSFIINSGACYQTVTLQFLSGNWYILSTAYNQSCL